MYLEGEFQFDPEQNVLAFPVEECGWEAARRNPGAGISMSCGPGDINPGKVLTARSVV